MKETIYTKNAPKCLGPYTQAIKTNNIIFISGQIGICPETNKISNDIEKQTYQTLKNIKEIIQSSGLNIHDIVKTTIFITNINDINTINTIYKNFFNTNTNKEKYPTRSCVEVKSLPKNAKIEIEAIAIASHR